MHFNVVLKYVIPCETDKMHVRRRTWFGEAVVRDTEVHRVMVDVTQARALMNIGSPVWVVTKNKI